MEKKLRFLIAFACCLFITPLGIAFNGTNPIVYKQTILSLHDEYVKGHLEEKNLVEEIALQNVETEHFSLDEIKALEQRWETEFETREYLLLPKLLTRPIAINAARIKESAQGHISSIYFIDMRGLNVAQSNVTKHYWHGNQSYFINAEKTQDNPYIHPVTYDEVSDEFIVTAMFPVHDASEKIIGYTVIDFSAIELEYINIRNQKSP